MHKVVNRGLSDPFGRSNEPQSVHTPHFGVLRIQTSKMPNFFGDVRQELVYAYGWPSRIVGHIWKVKQAPKRAYP